MMNCRNVSIALSAIAGLALSAIAVPPSPAPAPSTGPDVVVGGIGSGSGTAPYGDSGGTGVTTNGSSGSITAYSVGTISCNLGNQLFIWIRDTSPGNRHPVIGTQIFRYRTVNGAGQFEQVGMNWLKHGFCAADASNCSQLTSPNGTLASNGSCDWLGPFATDTYSASLNGSQSNLGPRSEVNPWTGAYPYPYVLQWGGNGGNATVGKRIQVLTSDLVAGANWLFEVCYIPSQNTEPTANKYNNYSYRPATLSGTTFTFSGATEALRPAIVGWKEKFDNAVTLVNVDPSGTSDGRLILGYKVTQTGPSTWHYEYNLHNMNNDAGVGSFALPVDSNVALSNVGFHMPFYHSGEPYSNTDWAFTNGGGTASWATQTFAQNANASACRWSTTYSFRFDANVGPVAGNITLGMFKTGGSVNVAAQVPAVPPPPTPGPFNLSSPSNGSTTADTVPVLSWTAANNASTYTVKVATDAGLTNVVDSSTLPATAYQVSGGALANNTTYYWGVTANNGAGSTGSTPASWSFITPPPPCQGDIDGDGHTNTADLVILLGNFGQPADHGCCGDLDGSGTVGTADLTILLGGFGC